MDRCDEGGLGWGAIPFGGGATAVPPRGLEMGEPGQRVAGEAVVVSHLPISGEGVPGGVNSLTGSGLVRRTGDECSCRLMSPLRAV